METTLMCIIVGIFTFIFGYITGMNKTTKIFYNSNCNMLSSIPKEVDKELNSQNEV